MFWKAQVHAATLTNVHEADWTQVLLHVTTWGNSSCLLLLFPAPHHLQLKLLLGPIDMAGLLGNGWEHGLHQAMHFLSLRPFDDS